MNVQVWRLLLICTAWSLGVVLVWLVDARGLDVAVPAIFAVAAYVLTRDIDLGGPRGGRRSGGRKYWRGRRVDDEPRRKRWN